MAHFTEDAIRQSFLKLLNERPYRDITVKDIVTDCGINRNTFYNHFESIPALLERIIREQCDDLIARYPTISSFEQCVQASVEFAQENRRALMHIYRSLDRAIAEEALWKICDHVTRTYFETLFSDRKLKDGDREILLRYYKGLLFGQTVLWLDEGMQGDIVSQVRRLCELREGQAEEMIRRSEEG